MPNLRSFYKHLFLVGADVGIDPYGEIFFALVYLGQEISIMRSMVSWRVWHWAVSAAR